MKHYYSSKFFSCLIVLILSFSGLNVYAVTCTSLSDGDWSQDENWSCGRAPQCGDTIFIDHDINIDMQVLLDEDAGCTTPTFIVVSSTGGMHFEMGQKMRLACGSGITLEAGATLTADAYVGVNSLIEICNSNVWVASDGAESGPLVFGSGLPIELLSFDTYRNENHIVITWETATETDNDFFTVERSSNGMQFEPIAIVQGAGNSSSFLSYLERDNNPLPGTSYYRLKQTDYNGQFSYSHIIVLRDYFSLAGELHLYPNPTDGAFHLLLSGFGDEEVLVVVRDITGKEQYSKIVVTSTDSHLEAIDPTNRLAAGTYIVTASSRNEFYTQKLVVR